MHVISGGQLRQMPRLGGQTHVKNEAVNKHDAHQCTLSNGHSRADRPGPTKLACSQLHHAAVVTYFLLDNCFTIDKARVAGELEARPVVAKPFQGPRTHQGKERGGQGNEHNQLQQKREAEGGEDGGQCRRHS